MITIYKAVDGEEFQSEEACRVYEAALERKRQKAKEEDFMFMVTCASKGNMAMYELLKDRSKS